MELYFVLEAVRSVPGVCVGGWGEGEGGRKEALSTPSSSNVLGKLSVLPTGNECCVRSFAGNVSCYFRHGLRDPARRGESLAVEQRKHSLTGKGEGACVCVLRVGGGVNEVDVNEGVDGEGVMMGTIGTIHAVLVGSVEKYGT